MQRQAANDPSWIGNMMIERHGLRAAAVASERLAEAQAAGDTAGSELWTDVKAAIQEIRRSNRGAGERGQPSRVQ